MYAETQEGPYESLQDLAIDLGCNYLKELHVAGNATYRSRHIVGEFLQKIFCQVEEDTLQQLVQAPTSQ